MEVDNKIGREISKETNSLAVFSDRRHVSTNLHPLFSLSLSLSLSLPFPRRPRRPHPGAQVRPRRLRRQAPRRRLHQGHEGLPAVRLLQHRRADPVLGRRPVRDRRRLGGREAAVEPEGVLGEGFCCFGYENATFSSLACVEEGFVFRWRRTLEQRGNITHSLLFLHLSLGFKKKTF